MNLVSLPPPYPVHPMCPSCGKTDCARYQPAGVCPAAANITPPDDWELVPIQEKPL